MAQGSGTVRGSVHSSEDGRPIPGAQVGIEGTDRTAITDDQGRYVLTNVPAGVWTVRVEGIYRSDPRAVELRAGGEVSINFDVDVALFTLAPIDVRATRTYRQDATTLGTRGPAQIRDVPGSVHVLSRKFIEDRGATRFEDLYRNVSGLVDHPYSEVILRGFQQREVLFNGVRGNPYGSLDGGEDTGFSTSVGRLTNIERVEILKGPASVLYGAAEPGGVINYVTKKPLDVFESRLSFIAGGFQQRGFNAEATGPIGTTRRFLYRGALYFEEKDGFRNNAGFRDVHVVAGATWKASERTRVDIEAERIDQDLPGHRLRGIPVEADGTFLTNREWSATEPTDFTKLDATVAQLALNHAFAGGTGLDATFRILSYDRAENYHEPRGILADGRSMQREFRDQSRGNDDWSATINLNRRFSLRGAGEHVLTVGGEVANQDWRFRFGRARQSGSGGPVPDLDLLTPVYQGGDPTSYGLDSSAYAEQSVDSRRLGAFAQEQVFLGDTWVATGGVRFDHYRDRGLINGESGEATSSAVTGRLGIVHKPTRTLSLYGNVANGFNRPEFVAQVPSANGPFDPSRSRQVEAGLKADLLARRLMITAAGFTITKTNVLRPDPDLGPNGDNFSAVLATGEVRSRGIELDLVGSISESLAIAANYALLGSEITRDDDAPDNVGRPWPNAARHSAGLTGRYAIGSGGLAASMEYVGAREQPFAGIEAPAYTVLDLSVDVRLARRFELRVMLDNVFDKTYAVASLFAARAGNIPGDPRTLSVQVSTATTWWRQ